MAAVVTLLVARRSAAAISSSTNYLCCNNFTKTPHCYYYVQQLLCFSTKKSSTTTTTSPPLPFTEDYFIAKYNFSPEIASKLVFASANKKNPQNPDAFLSFLKQSGFSISNLERIIRHHTRLLSMCPEMSVKPKLKVFQEELCFSAAEAAEIIARDPNILIYQPNRIVSSLSVYRRLLGSNDNVIKLFKKYGSLLYADPEETVLPNIQFLKECGIQMDQINAFIHTNTRLLSITPENMRRCVHKVDEMGVPRTSKMFIHAVWAVSKMSDETLKLKLKTFQDLGFSQDDILRLFRTVPWVSYVSTRKIKEVTEVLLETGKYDMSCIIKNPESFTRSVEKRFKPRLEVLKALERKSLIDKWPGLSKLCCMTDNKFYEKFVAPNINEVGKDFVAKTAVTGKGETQPS